MLGVLTPCNQKTQLYAESRGNTLPVMCIRIKVIKHKILQLQAS